MGVSALLEKALEDQHPERDNVYMFTLSANLQATRILILADTGHILC